MWRFLGDFLLVDLNWAEQQQQQWEFVTVNVSKEKVLQESLWWPAQVSSDSRPLHQHGIPPLFEASAWRQFVFRAFRRGGRAACSPPSLQPWRCRGAAAESPLARHRQFLGSRRQSSGPGAAGGGCCRTALGPNPRWRPSRRKQEVWRRGSPWAAADWRGGDEEGGALMIREILMVLLDKMMSWCLAPPGGITRRYRLILINGLFHEVKERFGLDHNNTYIFITFIFFPKFTKLHF